MELLEQYAVIADGIAFGTRVYVNRPRIDPEKSPRFCAKFRLAADQRITAPQTRLPVSGGLGESPDADHRSVLICPRFWNA
jgi:hypothetical protein